MVSGSYYDVMFLKQGGFCHYFCFASPQKYRQNQLMFRKGDWFSFYEIIQIRNSDFLREFAG